MPTTYRTRQGDMLDDICHRHYGRTGSTVEAVLAANRDIADLGPVLPPGIDILLPDLPAPDRQRLARLWGAP